MDAGWYAGVEVTAGHLYVRGGGVWDGDGLLTALGIRVFTLLGVHV